MKKIVCLGQASADCASGEIKRRSRKGGVTARNHHQGFGAANLNAFTWGPRRSQNLKPPKRGEGDVQKNVYLKERGLRSMPPNTGTRRYCLFYDQETTGDRPKGEEKKSKKQQKKKKKSEKCHLGPFRETKRKKRSGEGCDSEGGIGINSQRELRSSTPPNLQEGKQIRQLER